MRYVGGRVLLWTLICEGWRRDVDGKDAGRVECWMVLGMCMVWYGMVSIRVVRRRGEDINDG